MSKRSLVSFVYLFLFWIVISGVMNPQNIIVGMAVCLFTVWFWRNFNVRLPSMFLTPKELLLFGRCIILLIGEVIKSSFNVTKLLLFTHSPEDSIFLEFKPGIKSDWGKVFLAGCITITPGTITIDFDPESDIFTIHAITCETGGALYNWRIVSEIKNLETRVQRRRKDVVDHGRIDDPNSISSVESDNWAHRN